MRALDEPAAVDAGLLRGDADPRMAAPDEMPEQEAPVGADVDPARHVVPLDQDRAAEPLGIDGTPNEHARVVNGAASDGSVFQRPSPSRSPTRRYESAVPSSRNSSSTYPRSARSYVPTGIGQGPSSGRTVLLHDRSANRRQQTA